MTEHSADTVERVAKAIETCDDNWDANFQDMARAALSAMTVEDAAKVRIGLIADGLDDGEPEYHEQGMGCGLEDRNITDRYQAMAYGWDQAMERVYGEVIQPASEALRAIADTPKEGE